MKYPVWIKLKESGRILKAIDYLGMSDCYDCRYKSKRELISICEPVLFSRDKKSWLTFDELMDLDYPKIEYPKGSAMYYLDKYIGKAIDTLFKEESKKGIKNETNKEKCSKNT